MSRRTVATWVVVVVIFSVLSVRMKIILEADFHISMKSGRSKEALGYFIHRFVVESS